jgi:hypothetical protein
MYKKYDSKTKKIVLRCANCSKDRELDLKDVQLYVGDMAKGLFVQLPKCDCRATSTVYTGFKVNILKCHVGCTVAKAAFDQNCGMHLMHPEETEDQIRTKVEERLDELGQEYENGSVEHRQYLGDEPLIYSDPE